MTLFGDIFRHAALPMLSGVHGETVLYLPRNGAPRVIQAIVDGEDKAAIPGGHSGFMPEFKVTVANCRQDGISKAEIDTGGDRVQLIERHGNGSEPRQIANILFYDDGMMELGVR